MLREVVGAIRTMRRGVDEGESAGEGLFDIPISLEGASVVVTSPHDEVNRSITSIRQMSIASTKKVYGWNDLGNELTRSAALAVAGITAEYPTAPSTPSRTPATSGKWGDGGQKRGMDVAAI
jgi:hypothetical protein